MSEKMSIWRLFYVTRDEILAVLLRWNLWGNARKTKIVSRECIQKVRSFKDYHGVIVIKGPRRAGKSTNM